MGSAGRAHRPRERPPVAVEHRQGPQVAAVGVQAGVEGHRQRLEERAAVVVHHALRRAGRAAGVVDRQQRPLVGRFHRRRRRGVQQPVVLLALEHQAYVDPLGDLPRGVGELVGGDQDARAGVLDDVGQLVDREPDVERHQHRAAHRHAVVQLEHHVAVRAQRGDPVARFDAEVRQCPGQRQRTLEQLGVGEPALAVHHRGPIAEHARGAVQERRGRERGERERGHGREPTRPRSSTTAPSRRLTKAPPWRPKPHRTNLA